MKLLQSLGRDESGAVLSAEVVMIGTLAVLGGVVGLNTVTKSINGELTEISHAFRRLDQSYAYTGYRSPVAWTAGSYYTQPPIEESIAGLSAEDEVDPRLLRQRIDAERSFVTDEPTLEDVMENQDAMEKGEDAPPAEMRDDEPAREKAERKEKKRERRERMKKDAD